MKNSIAILNLIRFGIIFAFIITFLFASCQEDKVPKPPISLENMASCYIDSEWNENKIINALMGILSKIH